MVFGPTQRRQSSNPAPRRDLAPLHRPGLGPSREPAHPSPDRARELVVSKKEYRQGSETSSDSKCHRGHSYASEFCQTGGVRWCRKGTKACCVIARKGSCQAPVRSLPVRWECLSAGRSDAAAGLWNPKFYCASRRAHQLTRPQTLDRCPV
ncbi:hypothetical protein B0T16DRAFT_46528 [Cercophora newfieldiana]|uniref:Uncharacterized protein n=1 Tax=Cercophora newfieldiana TaxID=92897 RepID=A0AA40CZ58_9PEZI|nr:hypothetical protein B0T16DRAFT_46528 [Cercophora newfieldiana]